VTNPGNDGVPQHAADPEGDARNRALRTFLQGLAVDVLLTVALVVYDATSSENVQWRLIPLLLAKSVLTSAASYVMRKVKPPA
jgi:hypothetical protein